MKASLPIVVVASVCMLATDALQQQEQRIISKNTYSLQPSSLKGSLPRGHWHCVNSTSSYKDVASTTTWEDKHYGAIDGALTRDEVVSAFANKWVLMAGDSSVRMLFQLLFGVLEWNWTHFPTDRDKKSPDYDVGQQAFPTNCTLEHKDNPDENFCFHDSYLSNGIRLSALWMDFPHEKQLTPLAISQRKRSLVGGSLQRGAPDVIFVGVGTWHVKNHKVHELESDVDGALQRFDIMLPQSPQNHRIVAGVPNCDGRKPHSGFKVADEILLNATLRRNGWTFFDRGIISDRPCPNHKVCQFGFAHPVGAPLNVIAKLFLWQVQDERA